MPWDQLSAEQRRSVTLQLDYQHDPATEEERERWWDFYQRMSALEAELERHGSDDRVNLDELLDGSGKLRDIRAQIDRMKARERHAKDSYYPQRRVPVENCRIRGRTLRRVPAGQRRPPDRGEVASSEGGARGHRLANAGRAL